MQRKAAEEEEEEEEDVKKGSETSKSNEMPLCRGSLTAALLLLCDDAPAFYDLLTCIPHCQQQQ